MFNVYKKPTKSTNRKLESDGSKNASHDMGYLYDAWQKSDIWSQASYRYTILWVAFLDPSDSYFLFAELVGLYTQMRRKISWTDGRTEEWKDGRTDRRTGVKQYTPSPFGERGYKNYETSG
jgi:hypothetical protein